MTMTNKEINEYLEAEYEKHLEVKEKCLKELNDYEQKYIEKYGNTLEEIIEEMETIDEDKDEYFYYTDKTIIARNLNDYRLITAMRLFRGTEKQIMDVQLVEYTTFEHYPTMGKNEIICAKVEIITDNENDYIPVTVIFNNYDLCLIMNNKVTLKKLVKDIIKNHPESYFNSGLIPTDSWYFNGQWIDF